MAEEEKHYPVTDAPAPASEVPPAPAPTEPPVPAVTEPGETPAPATPEGNPPQDPPAQEPKLEKTRSIYQDLKDTRQEKNEWKETAITALKAQGVELKGDETPAQLQALIKSNDTPTPPVPATPPTPATPPAPANELEAFAQEQGLDPDGLKRLTEIIAKSIPTSQLTDEERQNLKALTDFKNDTDAKEQRRQEDDAIQAEAPQVKTQLAITDDKELNAVMAEVTRLAHTPQYANAEVDYIVYKNKDALSKLVSPKKASFEAGGQSAEHGSPEEVDFANGGKVTPEQASKAITRTKSSLEIRKAQ